MKIKLISKSLLTLTFLLCMGCGLVKKSDQEKGSVKEAYFNWVHEVETSRGHTEKVVDLYAKHAILMPTISPEICTTKEMRTKYFRRFLGFQNLQVETKQLITKEYGDIAMNAGYYNISYVEGNSRVLVEARFDFWYKKIDGEWKIIFHQSSMLPKEN